MVFKLLVCLGVTCPGDWRFPWMELCLRRDHFWYLIPRKCFLERSYKVWMKNHQELGQNMFSLMEQPCVLRLTTRVRWNEKHLLLRIFVIEIIFASLATSCLLGWAWISTKTEGWSHRHPLYPRQQRQYQRGTYCYIQDGINFQYISRKFLFCSMKSEETVFLLPGGTQSWCRPWDGGLSWLVEVKVQYNTNIGCFCYSRSSNMSAAAGWPTC